MSGSLRRRPQDVTPNHSPDDSLVYQLGSEVNAWMCGAPEGEREDLSDEVWAFALATYVDGVAITPLGYDVSDQLDGGEKA